MGGRVKHNAVSSPFCRHYLRTLCSVQNIFIGLVALFLVTTFILMMELESSNIINPEDTLHGNSGLLTVSIERQQDDFVQEQQHLVHSTSFRKATEKRNIPPPSPSATQTGRTKNNNIDVRHQDSNLHSVRTNYDKIYKHNSILLPLPPFLDYLGVLLDAGRHYFPMDWLYRYFLPNLYRMDYNYVHFRLTDDQNFALNLTVNLMMKEQSNNIISLGFSSRGEPVYQPHELRDFVKHAKEKYNITVIPEINIPGHAGAWGASSYNSLADLVVQCPNFACDKGYGIPLNVSHPHLPSLLRQVLDKVVQIFNYPPYLHLGGDELHMSEQCLRENFWFDKRHQSGDTIGMMYNSTEYMDKDIVFFETNVVQPIIEKLGYTMDQIVRWETSTKGGVGLHSRTGRIIHYWQTTPNRKDHTKVIRAGKELKRPKVDLKRPFMASTGLYLDLTPEYGYGYGDFLASVALASEPTLPFAIIVGTFELSTEFWEDRNILGRLLAIRLGLNVTSSSFKKGVSSPQTLAKAIDRKEYDTMYAAACETLFAASPMASVSNDYKDMCNLKGTVPLEDRMYQAKWKKIWNEWKNGLCDALSVPATKIRVRTMIIDTATQQQANNYFFDNLLDPVEELVQSERQKQGFANPLKTSTPAIQYAGVFICLVRNGISEKGFASFLRMTKTLTLNFVHLRLSDNLGQVVQYQHIPNTAYSVYGIDSKYLYRRRQLENFAKQAKEAGMVILPEINLASSGGGWAKSGMVANCPNTFCRNAEGIALDVVKKQNRVLPICIAAIQELREMFTMTSIPERNSWFHLGEDNRLVAAEGCLEEAGYHVPQSLHAFQVYEEKLSWALAAIGIDEDRILRWSEHNQTKFPNRTGTLSHYVNITDVGHLNTDSRFFGTVLVEDGMSSWEVFCATKAWITLSDIPLGLVLKHKGSQLPTFSHMVSFDMALSGDNSLNKEAEFRSRYRELCQNLDCNAKDSEIQSLRVDAYHGAPNLASACIEQTDNVTIRVPKPSSL